MPRLTRSLRKLGQLVALFAIVAGPSWRMAVAADTSLHGRVMGQTSAGEHLGPVAGAKVEIKRGRGRTLFTVETDEAGYYRVPNLAQGQYDYAITAEGFLDENAGRGFDLSADGAHVLDFVVTQGDTTTPAETEAPGRLAVLVRAKTADGFEPISRATLVLRRDGDPRVLSRVTGPRGQNQMNLAPGTWQVAAVAEGYEAGHAANAVVIASAGQRQVVITLARCEPPAETGSAPEPTAPQAPPRVAANPAPAAPAPPAAADGPTPEQWDNAVRAAARELAGRPGARPTPIRDRDIQGAFPGHVFMTVPQTAEDRAMAEPTEPASDDAPAAPTTPSKRSKKNKNKNKNRSKNDRVTTPANVLPTDTPAAADGSPADYFEREIVVVGPDGATEVLRGNGGIRGFIHRNFPDVLSDADAERCARVYNCMAQAKYPELQFGPMQVTPAETRSDEEARAVRVSAPVTAGGSGSLRMRLGFDAEGRLSAAGIGQPKVGE